MQDKSLAVEWSNPSSQFHELASLAGLDEHLGLGAEVPAPEADDDDGLCPVF